MLNLAKLFPNFIAFWNFIFTFVGEFFENLTFRGFEDSKFCGT